MTFLHLADLHLGKRLGEYDLFEEQQRALDEIVGLCEARRPDAVLIAGDVYDKPVPPVEAVRLLGRFLEQLCALSVPVMIISGNHDSPDRLGFGSGLLHKSGVYIEGAFSGAPARVRLHDRFGAVDFWLLPFVRPAVVRAVFARLGLPADGIADYTAALRAAAGRCAFEPGARNVLVAHQFVTAGGDSPARCDSETLNVGGLDDVDLSAFAGFDYVALGHLHGAQRVGRESVRYAGSPLAYSVSEQHHRKSVCLVTLNGAGEAAVELLPLHPLRAVRAVEGTLAALCAPDFPGREPAGDYVFARVLDDVPPDDPLARLRAVYPRLLGMELVRRGEGAQGLDTAGAEAARLDPMAALGDFFEAQLGRPLTEGQRQLAAGAFARAQEERP